MSTAQFGPIVVAGHSLGGTTAMVVSGAALDPLGFGCPDPDLSLCQRGVRASLEEGFRDPRIALCLAITPAGHPALLEHDAPLTQLEIPVLLVRAGSDGVLPPPQHTDAMWEVLRPREDVLMLNFEEAGHYSFADICAFNPKAAEAIEQFWNDGCSPEFPPAAEIESTTWAAMLAFTFEHLYGSEEARSWLSEPSSLLPHGVIAE
jgi:predicted dienelactone hydrolase